MTDINEDALYLVREKLEKPLSETGVNNCLAYLVECKSVAETVMLLETNPENFISDECNYLVALITLLAIVWVYYAIFKLLGITALEFTSKSYFIPAGFSMIVVAIGGAAIVGALPFKRGANH